MKSQPYPSLYLLQARRSLACMLLLLVSLISFSQNDWKKTMRQTDPAFFQTAEARRIGDQLLVYQRVTGGWQKNTDMTRHLSDKERAEVLSLKNRRNDSTTDNDATTMEMKFLARLYQATKEASYRDAFCRGVEYLISGQYESGGWPQFWPEMRGYQVHITYNDDAMANTMFLLRDIAQQKSPYDNDLTTRELRQKAQLSFDKGVECILNTQIVVDGQPTVWCQQHDRDTFQPAAARAFELPSYCTQESATLVRLLMEIPHPSEAVKRAVHGAMAWFDKYKITGYRLERTGDWSKINPERETRLVADVKAGVPLWGRFYDLKYVEPFVCDRDGLPRRRLEDIGPERRNGYSWYNSRPASLYKLYYAWADKHDPTHKLRIELNSKGGNETGEMQLFRHPEKSMSDFDAVVSSGESIQEAVNKAPVAADRPYKIFIRKGEYREMVLVDRPNIVLVGENRDNTVIVFPVLSNDTSAVRKWGYRAAPVMLTEQANDCVIAGLTIYNNYGKVVTPTRRDQMAVFDRATRTIILNCNIWNEGSDALALWAKGGDGMYYNADLYVRSTGTDVFCPRGWCYATRCRFYGDGRSITCHDGSGDETKKLVITNSEFDASRPTQLGRYYHDSQFFFVNCRLSQNMMDKKITYVHIDREPDPNTSGGRAYFFNCTRKGGHNGWLADNLSSAPGSPDLFRITPQWTFSGKWDPEKRIRELWAYIEY